MRLSLTGASSGVLVPRAGQDSPSGGQVATAGGFTQLYAWTLSSAGGAVVRFRDGNTITSEIIGTVNLSAGASSHFSIWRGLSLYNGSVFFELVSGSIEGSVEVG